MELRPRELACRRFTIKYMKCSNSRRTSCGPGLASGCPWKLNAGRSVRAKPCREPSNSERCVARSVACNVDSSTAKPWFWLEISTLPEPISDTGGLDEDFQIRP